MSFRFVDLFYSLLDMAQHHTASEFLIYVRGHVRGAVDRTMSSAGASEADRKVGESALQIAFDGIVNQSVGVSEK